jgi:hypothetical protein
MSTVTVQNGSVTVDHGLELELFQETLNPKAKGSTEQLEHKQVHRGRKEDCKGCRLIGRTRTANKRRVLGEIALNTRNNRPKVSVYGCLACDVALCREGDCFEQYHEQYVHYK